MGSSGDHAASQAQGLSVPIGIGIGCGGGRRQLGEMHAGPTPALHSAFLLSTSLTLGPQKSHWLLC